MHKLKTCLLVSTVVLSMLLTSCTNNELQQPDSSVANQITVNKANHPRNEGIWPQYTGLDTALRSNWILTDVIEPDSQFENWKGETVKSHDLSNQNPNNYDSVHNHYQNFLSEVWNFKPGTNAVAIWGDSAAIADGSKAWGGFFSARSNYKSFTENELYKKYIPNGVDFSKYNENYDAQLVGIEIDVLNDGKPGIYPNKAKTGLQIVGFGKPNSMAIEVRSEDTDKDVEERRGVWESGIYFKNSMAPYGRLVVADFDQSKMGFDFRKALFTEGIMQAKTDGVGTGIILNEGKSGELYGGTRWKGDENPENWLTLRAGEGGLRVVSQDDTTELLSIDNHGGIYLNGDVYVNGKKLNDLLAIEDRVEKLEKQLSTLLSE
ncbi:hypothetical protein [Paenibacillus tarimensis]|uniref:hypothetical protein n=1 Tax=Paenibacillus tarimensis TaxID=416012 RepID=UPI001F43C551|nr:hypothetical protein [Paenibacillus tarimensis]MCF2945886.1 hypothetical protein [Paenibacillus tarimensis]